MQLVAWILSDGEAEARLTATAWQAITYLDTSTCGMSGLMPHRAMNCPLMRLSTLDMCCRDL
jgi:hypothetical protein